MARQESEVLQGVIGGVEYRCEPERSLKRKSVEVRQ